MIGKLVVIAGIFGLSTCRTVSPDPAPPPAPPAAPETPAPETPAPDAVAPDAADMEISAAPEPPEPPAAPSHAGPSHGEPVEIIADWDHKAEAAQWTAMTGAAIDEIGGPLLASEPADIAAFCPAWPGLGEDGRRAFWIGLFSAMARYESGFDPDVSFDEKAHCPSCDWAVTRDGRNVVSRGLLQLSQESANAYRGCAVAIEDELTLHDPARNLRCGVAIMTRLVSRDQMISARDGGWKGGSAYWSVLRPGKLEAIQGFTSALPVCRPG